MILHGWEDSSKKGFIPELVKTLKGKKYYPYAIDFPNTNEPEFEKWLEEAEKEIKRIGEENLSIVGHSMGGLLALKLAEKYKINKLVLVAPVGSNPSKEYFENVGKELNKKDLEIFRKYQDRGLDVSKIKSNSNEIVFLFGKKDRWVNEEIREFYNKNFKDIAKIEIFDNYGHMSDSEGIKKLPEVEKLFDNLDVQEDKAKDKKKSIADKKEEKTEEHKPKAEEKKEVKKKHEAVASSFSVPVSKRHAMYILKFIKNKKIDEAVADLEHVIKFKKAVPFKGEIPHRKGMMSGRYPIIASKEFIRMLKGLKGNCIVNGMDLDKTKISFGIANWASRPSKRGGGRAKRSHITMKAIEAGNNK